MPHDLGELARVGRVLEEARSLLESEQARLEQEYGPMPHPEVTAGSPGQTLHGIRELATGMSKALEGVALAAGYFVIGLDHRADRKLAVARRHPWAFPSGADRMARPLGADTVRALELILELGFFESEIAVAIEVALAAPQATYPPDDWRAYDRERRWRAQSE